MSDQTLNTPELQSAQSAATSATQSATQASAAAFKMPQLLREAVSERFKESPLTGQFAGAAENFLTAVPQERAKLAEMVQGGGPVLSPNQQQSVLAGTRAANMVPLISLNDLLQSQFGSIDQLVGAGTGAFNAFATQQQGAAQLAQQQSSDLLNRLVTEQQLGLDERKFQEGIRQFNVGQAGGGGGGGGIGDILNDLLNRGTQTADAAKPPELSFTPSDINEQYGDDNNNVWGFDPSLGDWTVVGRL